MDDLQITSVIDYITNGGTLPRLCDLHKLNYAKVVRWIYSDPDRKLSYELALRDRNELYAQKILDELHSIGLADIRKAYGADGQLLPINEMPPEIASTIAAMEHSEVDGTKRIKMWDKLRALELLGKTMTLFKDKIEHTGVTTLEDLVTQSLLPPTPEAPPPALEAPAP